MQNNKFKNKEAAAVVKKQWVRLTRVCNNRCCFCLDQEAQDGSCVEFCKIKNILFQGKQRGAQKAVLSGGEPSLHPDFFKIIKLARDSGYNKIQVITNGRMFAYKGFLKKAVDEGINEITFSIHGHTRQLHDKQTGVKGSFEQSLRGLVNVLEIKKLIVNVDIVVNKINIRHLRQILIFFISLGVREFDILQVMPFGRAWSNWEKLFYDIKKELKNLKAAFELRKNLPVYLWANRFPPAYLEGMEDLIQHPVKLAQEAKACRQMFERYLQKGILMDCWGKRCDYCHLKNFCKDLVAFKIDGLISSYPVSFCLANKDYCKSGKRNFKFKKDIDISEFINFYLKERFFIKSLRCEACKFNQKCQGIHIDAVRQKGFSLFLPQF